MTQYNNLNVKLSNSQLHRLKPGVKNSTKVTSNLYKASVNNSLANIKLSKNSNL